MISIEHSPIIAVPEDYFTERDAGEEAMIMSEGVKLHSGLTTVIPMETSLLHLTTIGNRHVYFLRVRGYTVAKFIAIASAYANENFDIATNLVDELRPARYER